MPLVKYIGKCKSCNYEWEIRKLDTKFKRICPNCRSDEVEVTQSEVSVEGENAAIDPENEFTELLADMGINKSRETIAKVFFRGDIDNIDWLEEVLKTASIPANKRTMIKAAWFGLPSEQIEDNDDEEQTGGILSSNRSKNYDRLDKVFEENEAILARKIKAAQAKKLLEELEGGDDNSKKNKRLIKIPATNPDGSIMLGIDKKPIFFEVTPEELKDIQLAQQYMKQNAPKPQNDFMSILIQNQLEMMKLLISNKDKNGNDVEIKRLQDKIEEMNTIMLEKKIEGAFSTLADEIRSIKNEKQKGDALDRLEAELTKLRKLGVKIGGQDGVPIEELRKDKVIDEGINELRGLRTDISNKLDPFVQLAAESVKDQLKEQQLAKKKLIDERSKVTEQDAANIIKQLDANSDELKEIEKLYPEEKVEEKVVEQNQTVEENTQTSEPEKQEVIAMIFSNDKEVEPIMGTKPDKDEKDEDNNEDINKEE